MPAYWVARAKVNDPVEYKKYADRVPAIFAKYGAKVLARGGRYQTLEGPEKFNRFVVIEFPTFEQGVAVLQLPGIQGGRGLPPQEQCGGKRAGDDRGGRRRTEVSLPSPAHCVRTLSRSLRSTLSACGKKAQEETSLSRLRERARVRAPSMDNSHAT